MPRYIAQLLLLFLSFPSFSQTSNVLLQNTTANAYPWLLQSGQDLLFIAFDDKATTNVLYRYNGANQLADTTQMGCFPELAFVNMRGRTMVATNTVMIGCDATFPQSYLFEIDGTGKRTFVSTDPSFGHIRSMVQLKDSSYVILADHFNYIANVSGNLTKAGYHTFTTTAAVLRDSLEVLVSGINSNSIAVIGLVTQFGNISWTANFPATLTNIQHFGNKQFIGLGSDGKIYKMTAGLVPSGNSFLNNNEKTNYFQVVNDTIYALTMDASQIQKFVVADTSFNTIATKSVTTVGVDQKALLKLPGQQIAFLSNVQTSFPYAEQTGVCLNRSTISNGNIFRRKDLAFTKLEVDSFLITSANGQIWTTRFAAQATIKNTGSLPVTQFKLNWARSYESLCPLPFGTINCTQTLQPGDSVQISTGTQTSVVTLSKPLSEHTKLCMWVTSPDGEADELLENSGMCQNVIAQILGIPSRSTKPDVLIYPVPCSEKLVLECEKKDAGSFSITDIIGNQLLSGPLIESSTEINTGCFPDGMYIVLLKFSNSSSSFKVIVSH